MQNNKFDGSLMAQCVDWLDASKRAIETASPLKSAELDSKERKHQNLQSSVFGGGYVDQEPVIVNKNDKKIAFASNADWKTQAAQAHYSNEDGKEINAYKMRQQQLNSDQVPLDHGDYEKFIP